MTTNSNHQTLPPAAEDEMLLLLKSGNHRDFSKLYDTFSAALFTLLQKWVKDTGVAENLLQDVFVKAWHSRDLYDASRGRLFTWLYRITRNVCIDYFRSKPYKKNQVSVFGDDVPGLLALPNASADIVPDTIGLRKLVDRLRKEEKEVVEMLYFKGLTQRQVAEIINIPLGTVKTRMSKAIKELRYFFKNDWEQATGIILLN